MIPPKHATDSSVIICNKIKIISNVSSASFLLFLQCLLVSPVDYFLRYGRMQLTKIIQCDWLWIIEKHREHLKLVLFGNTLIFHSTLFSTPPNSPETLRFLGKHDHTHLKWECPFLFSLDISPHEKYNDPWKSRKKTKELILRKRTKGHTERHTDMSGSRGNQSE